MSSKCERRIKLKGNRFKGQQSLIENLRNWDEQCRRKRRTIEGVLAKRARLFKLVGNKDKIFVLEYEGANDETKRKLIKVFLKTQKA